MSGSDIAIIGLACRFPGEARSPEAFFEMLLQGRDAWTDVPPTRFNSQAFLHPNRERPGTLVAGGGYFLKEDVSKWDAPFFATSAVEARAIDPQQRLLLEVAYESLENAGIPIEAISGTEAACFVGGFTHDYKNIVTRDIQAAPQYSITGCAANMLANRVSWFFNLRGASVTTDTACSSSLAALHLACETIRSRSNKTRCALVGGTSLILGPDSSLGLNALGFLSPDSRCFAFDSRANGYARGEAICMLVVKHIDDAIRDGDPIRAVIRATGLNQDGKTAGIVLPDGDAQMDLIRQTYELAGLKGADTQYAELHGTGTKAGDPTEMTAIARTIAHGRKSPLYCGSVKTQIGHTEGAAGIAGVMKCVLALERGIIPPHLNFIKANPRLRLDSWNIILPKAPVPWPETETRRCSINNFGFGGTNAHAILDDASNYMRLRNITMSSPLQELLFAQNTDLALVPTTNGHVSDSQPRVFVLSAPEQEAITRQRSAYGNYLKGINSPSSSVMNHLAYTLAKRRSTFQWRHAVVASSVSDLLSSWADESLEPAKAMAPCNVSFVFTGQGAQWYAMGRELAAYEVFAASVNKSAVVISALGSEWNAWRELFAPESESRVNQAEYAQPLCTVLQIALVDQLTHWGVKPHAVVGHSSGEISAAYAAGALSREHCLKIAYHRGRVSNQAREKHPDGTMMAVGLSAEEAQQYLTETGDTVVVACVNSPASITLSGNKAALLDLQTTFNQQNIFCRLLQVENAYHSPQMRSVAEEYRNSIADITPVDQSSTQFYSSVDGHRIPTARLTADYWVTNLCSPVQFVAALEDMLYANLEKKSLKSKSQATGILLEIGPHSALGGPIKQFKSAHKEVDYIGYQSVLSRGQNAALTALRTVAWLWTKGVPVDLNKVNNRNEISAQGVVLADLPSYSWNHSTSYWHEARASRNHRFPEFTRHDIIGSRIDNYNPLEPVWRNHLQVSELPWLRDHQIHGDIIFPAAGMICAAIEAARQVAQADKLNRDVTGFELRDFCINRPLVIPENDSGVETFLSLKKRKLGMGSGAGIWHEFTFYSCQDNETYAEHACGLIEIQYARLASEVDSGKELAEEVLARQEEWNTKKAACIDVVESPTHYDLWKSQGLDFGPIFRGLTSIHQKDNTVVFETTIPDVRSSMPFNSESDLLIHPATLDACLQTMLVAIPTMDGVPKQIWIPTTIRNIQISSDISRNHGEVLHGFCDSSRRGIREMIGTIVAGNKTFDSLPGITMDGVTFTGLGVNQALPANSHIGEHPSTKLCSMPSWKPDVDLLETESAGSILDGSSGSRDELAQFCSHSHEVVKIMCRRTLKNLDPATISSLPEYLQKYVKWMRKRCETPVNGYTPSKVNGHTTSKVNGHTASKVNGDTPSKVNGDASTEVNGHTPSKVNGDTSSKTNGDILSINGHKPSLTNGHTSLPINGNTSSLLGPDVPYDLSDKCDDLVMENFLNTYPFDGNFCRHVFDSLDDIFTQKTTGISVLMAEDNLSRFYRETYGVSASTQALKNWFDLKGHKNPRLRVIEIGGGTASASVPVLETLGGRKGETPRFSKWTFTDISTGWFENASNLLQEWEPRVEYKRLDIESDAIEQGFDAESYDVVVALNVLHATKDMKKTLENCRRLLKPGGNLVLGENTNPNDISSFIFGTLPGWWVAEDGREDGPLLSQSEWDVALTGAGFTTADIRLPVTDSSQAHRMSVLISKRQDAQEIPSRDIIIVTPDNHTSSTGTLASIIRDGLERLGSRAEVTDIQTAVDSAQGKTVISLLEYETPFLEELGAIQFDQVQQLLLHSAELLWVTRSNSEDLPSHPSRRIVSGLLRCVKAEDASRRLYELHFSRELASDVDSAARTICRRLGSIWEANQDAPAEMETVEQNGALCIPRYIPDNALNRSLSLTESGAAPEIENLIQPKRPLKLTIGTPGMLDTLHFVDDDEPFQPLPEEDVEIEVKACAMNFLDIMIAMGQIQHPALGYEASGIIRSVGAKVTKFAPGDRVIYMGLGAMRTSIRSHQSCVHALPASLTLEEGVTIPIAYATAYQSLIEVARLQRGESVLIHAAAGGLGQALIQIARMLEAEIFCTVGSNAKKQAIIDLGVNPNHIFSSRDMSFDKGIQRLTQGRGVDVVVNSLAGEGLRKSWECLAPYGRFIEVGKKDILGNSGLDMRPFLRNTLFACVNLEDMMTADPRRSFTLVSKVLQLFQQGAIGLIRPIAVHDFTEVESVFRTMQRGAHIGKLVLRVTPESRVLAAPQKSIRMNLDPSSTYLLVGGLGGLGRAQALFMAEHGARHIAFISRSGGARQEAQEVLETLKALGVDARPYAADIADKSQLKEVFDEIATAMPPIRGVIQGAMVLDDVLFHKMTFKQWVTATRPKIQGSWNLHELLPRDLDFFIQLSSLAGIIGSVSQSNYSAGNTFQDALAQYRHAQGLPAQSIDLGLMKDIGYVEEHKDVAAHTSFLKLTSLGKDQFLHILKCAIAGTADGKTPFPTQLVVGAGSGGAIQASQEEATGGGDYYWFRTLPHFAYLQRVDVQETSANEDKPSSDGSIDRLSHATSLDAASEIVQEILLAKVTKIIMVPASDIDTSKPVYTYGVDSLVAVELRNWLALELKSDISIFDLTSSAPITEVCKKIATRSQLVPAELKEESSGGQ